MLERKVICYSLHANSYPYNLIMLAN